MQAVYLRIRRLVFDWSVIRLVRVKRHLEELIMYRREVLLTTT
jgi:hypothetical protein